MHFIFPDNLKIIWLESYRASHYLVNSISVFNVFPFKLLPLALIIGTSNINHGY